MTTKVAAILRLYIRPAQPLSNAQCLEVPSLALSKHKCMISYAFGKEATYVHVLAIGGSWRGAGYSPRMADWVQLVAETAHRLILTLPGC
jgi:hypothetical protein